MSTHARHELNSQLTSHSTSHSFIIPDSRDINGTRPHEAVAFAQRWLAIKRRWPRSLMIEERVATLRALSQTSRYLRALSLSRLWAVVQLTSVEELGRLRQTLRASPEIAQHIRSFSFFWGMTDIPRPFPGSKLTQLEMAFQDRYAIWDRLREEGQHEVGWDYWSETWGFFSDKSFFRAPGSYPPGEQDWSKACARRVGGSGPDDRGEDRVIKSVEDFTNSVNEVMASLSSLQTFAWMSTMAGLPKDSFNSLQSLKMLTSLAYGCLRCDTLTLHARK